MPQDHEVFDKLECPQYHKPLTEKESLWVKKTLDKAPHRRLVPYNFPNLLLCGHKASLETARDFLVEAPGDHFWLSF